MQRRHLIRILCLAPAALGLAACGGPGGAGASRPSGTVLAVARANQLDRFLQAIDTAGLAEMLAGPGPYTIFAPSDRAFAAARLPRDPGELRALMRYHIVPGMFTSDFLEGRDVNYATAAGSPLEVNGTRGLRVNGASVTKTDLMASNGVVYVIDRVLSPH